MSLKDALKELEKTSKVSRTTQEVKAKQKAVQPKPKPMQGPVMPKGYVPPVPAKDKPFYDPTKGPIISGPPKLEALAKKFIGSATAGLSNITTDIYQPERAKQLEKTAEEMPVASTLSSLAGYVAPTTVGAKLVKPLVTGTLKKTGSKLVANVAEGALIGTGITAAENVAPVLTGKKSAEQAAKDIGTGLATGAVLDVGLHGLSKVAKPIVSKIAQGIKLNSIERQAFKQAMNITDDQIDDMLVRSKNQLSGKVEMPVETPTVKPLVGRGSPTVATKQAIDTEPFVKPIVKPQDATESLVKPIGYEDTAIKPKSVASDIETPTTKPPETLKIPIPDKDSGKIAKVLTEMPKKRNVPLKEKLISSYQSLVTSDLPSERIGKQFPRVEQLASANRKVSGSVDYNIAEAMTDNEGKVVGKSLFDVFKRVPETDKEDLFNYAMHKHNINRYAEGKPVYGASLTDEMSKAELKKLAEKNPKLEEQSQEITKYMNDLMDNWALKSGLVNEDTLKQLRETYPNYVPTYRLRDVDKPMGAGGSKGTVSATIKKATGSNKDILPLDQQMAILTNKTIRAARKNEMYNAYFDAYEQNPEFVERWFRPVKKEKADLSDGVQGIVDQYDDPIKKVGESYVLSFYRNGEKVQAQISKDMYDAVKSVSELSDVEKVADTVKKYATNPFKSLITTYNPIFVVRNIMRDIPTAFIYSNDAVEWSKQMPVAFKEIISNGKAWKEYQSLGGTRSGIFSYEKGVKTPFTGKKQPGVVKAARKTVDAVETINNVTETLPRFAEYLATVKKGGGTYDSKLEGLMRASEITTDFSRAGKLTKTADAFIPYLNPSVQGIDKFFRQVKNKPLETAIKGGLTITVPSLILDQINKDNRDYKELSAREKNNYYLIPDDKGGFTRIPKSREVGVVFSTLFEWLSRRSRGEDVPASEIAEVIKGNFTPVSPFENAIWTPLVKSLEQIKDPEREVVNYAGMPIVPKSLQKYAPKDQYDQYTSEVAKKIGETANISPKVIDYLIRSYSGVVGQLTMPQTSATSRGVIESAFKTDPVFKSDLSNQFYNKLDKLTKELNAKKREDVEDAALKKSVKELNAVSRDISDLRKEQKSIDMLKLDKQTKEKRKRELQIKINDLARKAVGGTK